MTKSAVNHESSIEPTKPAIFAALSLDEALAAAQEQGKWLVIDATASWCGPCQTMDETTWVDPAVIEWLTEHAVTIQLDVDEDEAFSERFNLTSMPTVIVLQDEQEIDRRLGLQEPEELLAWLGEVSEGETTRSALAGVRREMATTLLQHNKLAAATEEYLWLWDHWVGYAPVAASEHFSEMMEEIKELTAQHPPAKEAFSRLRDALTPLVQAKDAPEQVILEWLTLNKGLGDEDRSVSWFDSLPPLQEQPDSLKELVEAEFYLLLRHRSRWADLGRIDSDPMARLREAQAQMESTIQSQDAEEVAAETAEEAAESAAIKANAEKWFAWEAGILHHGLHAAGRESEALALAAEARQLAPSESLEESLQAAGKQDPPSWVRPVQEPAPTQPAIFAALSLDEGLAAAQEQKKWLVISVFEGDCTICPLLNENTWVDPELTGWLTEHAVTIQLHADKDKAALARFGQVDRAAVIILDGEEELDRSLSHHLSDGLLAWLKEVAEGDTTLGKLAKTRYDRAGELLERNQLAAATEEYLWLWRHLLEYSPSMLGVRASYLVDSVKELAAQHPPAKETFTRLRDALTPALPGKDSEQMILQDWLGLNSMISDEARSIAWFDSLPSLQEQPDWVKDQIEIQLIPLLFEAERWADAMRLYPDPIATIREAHAEKELALREDPASVEILGPAMEGLFLGKVRTLHTGLQAAGRENEALALAEEARRLAPSEKLEAALRGESEDDEEADDEKSEDDNPGAAS